MADVFVSYSRADGAFVRELHAFLTERGKEVWVDWEDIPPGSQWEQDIDDNIDAADSFVFVISGSSLASEYCAGEFRHAGERGKRIVPIACDGVDPGLAPEALRQLNWIWCRTDDDRTVAFKKLLEALDTDLTWARAHTRLLVRAVEWDARRDNSLLLRGRDLDRAVHVIAENAGKQPVPTELQKEYLLASRRASARRQRIILGSVSLALVVSVSLGIVALLQRNAANDRARIARSQALAAQAVESLDTAPVRALRDAVEAMDMKRTSEARVALRRAILANPIEYTIPAAAPASPSRAAGGDALAFSSDGRALLGLTPDQALHVWRSASGRPLDLGTRATAFAQHGRLVLTGGGRAARVVDLRSGASRVLHAPKGMRVIGVGFTRGVPRAAVAARGAVALEDVPTGRAVRLRIRATQAMFSHDGRRVVTLAVSLYSNNSPTRVWDARSGRLLATLPIADKAAVSPDGRFVATIYGTAALWRVGDRARLADLGQADGVFFSPDGKLVLAVDTSGSAGLWNVATGSQIAAFPGFGSLGAGAGESTRFSPGAAFSPDGRLVAIANDDGIVRIWEVATRKQVGAVAAGWANALAFAPRGNKLAAMTWNGDVVVARASASVPLRTGLTPSTCTPDFSPLVSPDGKYALARGGRGAGLWTLDGTRLAVFRPPARPAGNESNVGSAAFSGDGKMVAAATSGSFCARSRGEKYFTALWRVGGRKPWRVLPDEGPLLLDTHGDLVAVGGHLWRTATRTRVPGVGSVVALGQNRKVALVLRRGALSIVNLHSGRPIAWLRKAGPLASDVREGYDVVALFSPDGSRLLTTWSSGARLWNATTGARIADLGRKDEGISDVRFSADGQVARATFADRAAIFATDDGKLVSSVAGSFDGAVFSQDGTLVATPRDDGGIAIVDLRTRTRAVIQTDTAFPLTPQNGPVNITISFGPTSGFLVARDANGDVHVVRCEICADEDRLLALARAHVARLSRFQAKTPPVGAVG